MSTTGNRGALMSRAALERLWSNPKVSRQVIGDMLGISASGVGWRAKALGLPPRKGGEPAKWDWEGSLFLRMWNANVRPAEMGRHFGVSTSAILWGGRRRGLTRYCTRHNSISLEQFQELEFAYRISEANAHDRAVLALRRKAQGGAA